MPQEIIISNAFHIWRHTFHSQSLPQIRIGPSLLGERTSTDRNTRYTTKMTPANHVLGNVVATTLTVSWIMGHIQRSSGLLIAALREEPQGRVEIEKPWPNTYRDRFWTPCRDQMSQISCQLSIQTKVTITKPYFINSILGVALYLLNCSRYPAPSNFGITVPVSTQ